MRQLKVYGVCPRHATSGLAGTRTALSASFQDVRPLIRQGSRRPATSAQLEQARLNGTVSVNTERKRHHHAVDRGRKDRVCARQIQRMEMKSEREIEGWREREQQKERSREEKSEGEVARKRSNTHWRSMRDQSARARDRAVRAKKSKKAAVKPAGGNQDALERRTVTLRNSGLDKRQF